MCHHEFTCFIFLIHRWRVSVQLQRKMVLRKFQVLHNHSNVDLDYDTDDGFQVFSCSLLSQSTIQFSIFFIFIFITMIFDFHCRFFNSSSTLSLQFHLLNRRFTQLKTTPQSPPTPISPPFPISYDSSPSTTTTLNLNPALPTT